MILKCHNPYFNRWFSAITVMYVKLVMQLSHNPYFNRWFSAIKVPPSKFDNYHCHNPYFNRWFSAIANKIANYFMKK